MDTSDVENTYAAGYAAGLREGRVQHERATRELRDAIERARCAKHVGEDEMADVVRAATAYGAAGQREESIVWRGHRVRLPVNHSRSAPTVRPLLAPQFTKRELLAAFALVALYKDDPTKDAPYEHMAECAFLQADAMLGESSDEP